MNRAEKTNVIERLNEKFKRAQAVVLTEYKGMTVAELNDLRETLKKSQIEYRVVKNTLAKKATDGTTASAARERFKGPLGIAISYGEGSKAAKLIFDFAKKNEKLNIMCGVVEGTLYESAQLKAVADLPSREVLLSMLAGTMNAPATKMAQLLNATVARFAYAIGALKTKKENS